MPTTEDRSRQLSPTRQGLNLFVDGVDGSDLNGGLYPAQAFKTIAACVTAAAAHAAAGRRVESIRIAPSDYAENVTIPRALNRLLVKGEGGPGSVAIEADGADEDAITVHADDVRFENIGGAGTGTGAGLVVTGRRFSCDAHSKFENQDGTGASLVIGPGTVAEIDAGTKGKGDFARFEGTEFAYSADGVKLQGSDYAASGQHQFLGTRSHNITAGHFTEGHTAGGADALHYRDILIEGHKFQPAEDGTLPTKFCDLNDDNGNTAVITDCVVPVAMNSGKNLVSTAALWVANRHPAGLSTGQPS